MEKGKLTNVVGDVTNPQRTHQNIREIVFLPHVCNDLGGWGAGVVLAISKKWKGAEFIYRAFIAKHGKGKMLSTTGFWNSNENDVNDDIVICNMIAQSGYKSKDNPRPLNYKALVKCMEDVAKQLEFNKLILETIVGSEVLHRIHCPKFGSDLAGGNWEFITCLIEDIWLAKGIDVVVYEYGG